MSENIDAGIFLNIRVPRKNVSRDVNSSKKRIIGNRRQRIKARKSLKHLKQRSEPSLLTEHQPEETEKTSNLQTSLGENQATRVIGNTTGRKTDSEPGKHERPKKSGPVISSLFTHNPDIPVVQRGCIKQLKEDLFSSDSFKDAPLHPYMISNLEKLGFTKMTTAQQETIPQLVGGHDLLLKSQTGSGKTMAYAIPIIEQLCRQSPKLKRSDGCHAIIVVPTRELALQSYDVFLKLLKPFTWLVPGCIMGGEKRKAEKARLRKGINILVATPGRLLDHVENTQNLILEKTKWLVIDEADRLLELGFEEKVSNIVQAIDKHGNDRQTVLLSATLSHGVERLAGMSLNNPKRISIVENKNNAAKGVSVKSAQLNVDKNLSVKEKSSPDSEESSDMIALPDSLKQYFVIAPCKLRLVVLLTLIFSKCKRESQKKMIVFSSTQDGVEFLYRLVRYLSKDHSNDSDVEDDEPVTSLDVHRLHGDMSQKERTMAFNDFSTAKSGLLLCTDVAARGLHLPSVHWVIQYTCPTGITDYVHRVGRTARAGTLGNTMMFLLPSETEFVKHLNQKNISIEELKLGHILEDIIKLQPGLPGVEQTERQVPRTVEETATYLQNCCELYVKNASNMTSLAKRAYQSFIRAYATYPHNLKMIFHVRNLHLGHVAKTFGLRAAPSDIGNIPGVNLNSARGKRKLQDKDQRPRLKMRKMDMSEYKSPLVFTSNKKNKQKGGKQKDRKNKK